ncbi:hypothetical protein DB346_14265 [Verrucomicrobia bacterium LW23]|nr:hypothetical protein DB346_14265 [Verrucomicrobia bacterium LW23]
MKTTSLVRCAFALIIAVSIAPNAHAASEYLLWPGQVHRTAICAATNAPGDGGSVPGRSDTAPAPRPETPGNGAPPSPPTPAPAPAPRPGGPSSPGGAGGVR